LTGGRAPGDPTRWRTASRLALPRAHA
jgi:hypothetical protein